MMSFLFDMDCSNVQSVNFVHSLTKTNVFCINVVTRVLYLSLKRESGLAAPNRAKVRIKHV